MYMNRLCMCVFIYSVHACNLYVCNYDVCTSVFIYIYACVLYASMYMYVQCIDYSVGIISYGISVM